MKIFYRCFLVIVLAIAGFMPTAHATHVAGADISYENIGQDSFLVTLNLFRDCSGASLGTTANMTFSCPTTGVSFNQQLTLMNPPIGTEVSQLCAASIVNSTCNGGTLPGMQHYIYQTTVVLSPACNSWNMSWSLCCRNSSNNVSGQGNMYITASLNNVANDTNSSPFFNAQPIPYVCQNQLVNYNFGVTEQDGDSIVYEFTDPLTGATAVVPWNPGFSTTQPLPGIFINTNNGQLTFTPTTLGHYVLAVRACEYEYGTGVLKGCVTRDIQFVVIACTNNQPEAPANGFSNVTGNGVQTSPDSIEVCVGNLIGFDLIYTDSDTADSISLISNVAAVLPGATVTVTGGNPATISVQWLAQAGSPPLNSFAVTANDNACPTPGLVTTAYNIIVVPATYGGPNQTICQGSQWAPFNAVGGSLFTWTTITGDPIDTIPTSPGYNATCQNCPDPQFSPSQTTTYLVTSNLAGQCINTDTVTVTVVPDFNIIMPADTLICSVDDYQLLMTTDQPTFSYTYKWSPSGSLDYDTVAQPICNPSDPTVYTVTVSTVDGCIKSDNVFIDLSPAFPSDVNILGDTVLCLGQTTQLDVEYGDMIYGSCGPTLQSCLGTVQNGIVGTGTATNGTTTFPCIYGTSQGAVKHQILYRANELNAMGMPTGGLINTIEFFINTLGSPPVYENFTIKMGCVSDADLSNGWITYNLSEVYTNAMYNAVTGWNSHALNMSYKWDGTSNLVVEICWDNQGAGNDNAIMPYTATGYQSVIYATSNSGGICNGYPTQNTLSNKRPNTRFNFCSGVNPAALTYSWVPGTGLSNTTIPNPIASPVSSTTYNLYLSDTVGGCSDTIPHFIDVVTQFDAGFSFNDPYCISDAPDSLIANVGGGFYTGSGVDSSGWFDPALAGVGSIPITYHIPTPTLCANDSTMNIVVIPLPDATISPAEVCQNGGPITLTAATPGGVWSGSAITDSINGTFDPTGLAPGGYTVYYELYIPCYNVDTQVINIISPYIFTFDDPNPEVCQGSTLDLSGNYTLGNNGSTGPVMAVWADANGLIDSAGLFDATTANPGVYQVTLTISGIDGSCDSTQTLDVTVLQADIPQFLNELEYCDNQFTGVIEVSPWLFGSPNAQTTVSFTQTPLGNYDTLDIQPFGPNLPANGKINPSQSPIGQWDITVTYTNINGCTASNSDTIEVKETPQAPEPVEKSFCAGDEMILEANSPNAPADSIYWYDDQNLLDTLGIGSPFNAGIAPNPNNGPVRVYLTAQSGVCISPVTEYTLPIKESPEAAFTMTFTDTSGTVVEGLPNTDGPIWGYTPFEVAFFASNYTDGKDSVFWNHRADVYPPDPSGMNFGNWAAGYKYSVANVDEDGNIISNAYICQMIITNEFGCSDSAEVQVYSVASSELYNVFTPNGDGENDVFYVPVYGLTDYKVEIYNRWGQKLVEWDNPEIGWDGKGQPDGVYFYVVIGTKSNGEAYKKNGTVTISGSNN